MKTQSRVILSVSIAVVVAGSLIAFFLSMVTGTRSIPLPRTPESLKPLAESSPEPTKDGDPPQESENREESREKPKVASPEMELAEEKPIEEWVLGEDPGAVYYMSRIREAYQEGNPRFARELLRQMKENHPESGLIEEAEILFEKRGRIR